MCRVLCWICPRQLLNIGNPKVSPDVNLIAMRFDGKITSVNIRQMDGKDRPVDSVISNEDTIANECFGLVKAVEKTAVAVTANARRESGATGNCGDSKITHAKAIIVQVLLCIAAQAHPNTSAHHPENTLASGCA